MTEPTIAEDWVITDYESQSTDSGYRTRSFNVEGSSQEITKLHWAKNETRPNCMNKSCRFKFTLLKRQHHCRKCGEVFCNNCVAFRRTLSLLANYDPQGKLYKVCESCYLECRDDSPYTRSRTEDFNNERKHRKQQEKARVTGKAGLYKSWRDMLNLGKECERLREGFKKCFTSEVKRTLNTVEEMIKTPDWQKSSVWLMTSMTDKCNKCASGFGLLTKKYCCKVCGVVLCKSCIHKELLVYIPDDVNDNIPADVELAIIKIVGCPEVEPEISVLLHVCTQCRKYLVGLQEERAKHQARLEAKDIDEGVIASLIEVNKSISTLQTKLVYHLAKYREIIESLDNNSRGTKSESNTKILAKAQSDLSDHFASLSSKIPAVKQLVAATTTDTQKNLLRNYLKSKSDFYLDNVNTFRKLKRKLAEAAPPEVLEHIQKIVDKNAIVCAQIFIRQLIFESIHLCVKYSLQECVSILLKPLDEKIEIEALQCLQSQGEDAEQHTQYLTQIVKQQMQDRRLIRPSRRKLSQHGRSHAAEILVARLPLVLDKVKVQLTLKSVDRSFKGTKDCLEKTLDQAQQLQSTDLLTKK